MNKYLLNNTPVSEHDAASAWLAYTAKTPIDMPQAINLWEDAATIEGAASREKIAAAGIVIQLEEGKKHVPEPDDRT
ncbi:MAG: hypothetical protein ACRYG5_16795 [Janthinobacterium lividum]